MAKLQMKKGDSVTVISGASRGKAGKVLTVNRKTERVVIEGVNVRKKTVKRSQDHPNGGIVEMEMPIHISNVMSQDKYDKRKQK